MKKLFVLLLFFSYFFFLYKVMARAKPMIIYIDPGHGGFDGGASYLGIYEKDINLQVSLRLRNYFEVAGYRVIMTRSDDYALYKDEKNKKKSDIHNRVNMIEKSDCLLYLSIHANAYPMASLYGGQTFYKLGDEKSEELALLIQNSLVDNLKNTKRKHKPIHDVYLIDNISKTGVLVEIGFLSNENERKLLQEASYQDLMAYAIYMGCCDYLGKNVFM